MFVPVPGSCSPTKSSLLDEGKGELFKRQKFLDAKPPQLYQEAVSHLIKSNIADNNNLHFSNTLNDQTMPLMVVTGHQPSLLTGPLFTIYKSLTAVEMARKLSQLLQRNVIPLFWLATEDHDLNEVGKLNIPSNHKNSRKITLKGFPQGLPIGELPLKEENVKQVVEDLSSALPSKASFKNDLLHIIYEIGVKSASLGRWFAGIMSFLMEDKKILFYDPYPAVKKGIYERLIKEVWHKQDEINEALTRGEKEIINSGCSLQVKRDGRETHLMITFQGRRMSLFKEKNSCFTRGKKHTFSFSEIEDLMVNAPSLFTPNVLLRPVFQDFLFPNLCYVAGPGERAYSRQIKYLYGVFGLEPPVVVTRSGVTMVNKQLASQIKKWQLPIQGLFDDDFRKDIKRLPYEERKSIIEQLFPNNKPQERVNNFSYYWAQHGPLAWNNFVTDFPWEPAHYLYYW